MALDSHHLLPGPKCARPRRDMASARARARFARPYASPSVGASMQGTPSPIGRPTTVQARNNGEVGHPPRRHHMLSSPHLADPSQSQRCVRTADAPCRPLAKQSRVCHGAGEARLGGAEVRAPLGRRLGRYSDRAMRHSRPGTLSHAGTSAPSRAVVRTQRRGSGRSSTVT